MKLVIAVIQPTKLNAVREALEKVEVTRVTIGDAQEFARQRDPAETYWEREHAAGPLRKIVLEIVVNDDFLDRTVETITNVARTGPDGASGDGVVFVVPAEEAIQVNDSARGPGSV